MLLMMDQDSLIDSLGAGLDESRFREDTLRSRVWDAQRERDDAVGRAEYREAQLERLSRGSGVDPPPCWLDAEGNPEHLFRIELTDRGMRIFKIAPRHRITGDPEAARYWIRPVDRTGDRKAVFQERRRALWRRFWFRW